MPCLTASEVGAQLVAAHHRVVALRGEDSVGLADWRFLVSLALGSPDAERPALSSLIEQVAARRGPQDAECLVGLCQLLPPSDAQARLRTAWLAAPPEAWAALGVLLAALPAPEHDALLAPALARALDLDDDDARWSACDDLTGSIPEHDQNRWTRWFAAECKRRFGRVSLDPYRRAGAEPDVEREALLDAMERDRWGATFEAWRLGDHATTLAGPERSQAFDRAIDAFERLIPTPIDPGNDEGPFWAIARHLSLDQTRRALSILGRMQARDWCYELAGSRAALGTRLAWLGQPEEALAVLQQIGTEGDFDAHWRATAWGGLVSGRLAHEPTLSLERALAAAQALDARSLRDTQGRFRILSELLYRFDDHSLPPARAAALAEACLDEVRALEARDAHLADILLEECLSTFGLAMTTERWLEVLARQPEGPERIDLYEALLEVERERNLDLALGKLLDELNRCPPPYPVQMLNVLMPLKERLPPEALLPVWSAWLATFGDPKVGFVGTERDLDELREHLGSLVATLGGPTAPAEACRALAEVVLRGA